MTGASGNVLNLQEFDTKPLKANTLTVNEVINDILYQQRGSFDDLLWNASWNCISNEFFYFILSNTFAICALYTFELYPIAILTIFACVFTVALLNNFFYITIAAYSNQDFSFLHTAEEEKCITNDISNVVFRYFNISECVPVPSIQVFVMNRSIILPFNFILKYIFNIVIRFFLLFISNKHFLTNLCYYIVCFSFKF